MLKTRILTALVLLPLMLGMLFFANQTIWAIFTAIIALLALWEYGRLCHLSKVQYILYLGASFLVGLWAYWYQFIGIVELYIIIPIFWLVIVPLWLKFKWKLRPNLLSMLVGWLLILPFWQALITFRPTMAHGIAINSYDSAKGLLVIMSIVWIADISAYFIGRSIGKHKLAPVISPNKSWEGAIGAVVCVAIYIALLTYFFLPRLPIWLTVGGAMILTLISILGDLFESWLKRAAGIKDSSQLLPGHGGILDRIDSLVAVLSMCLATVMLTIYINGIFS